MRKFTAIMAVTLLAFAATACGDKKGENVETEAAATNAAGETENEADAEVIAIPEEYEAQYFEGIVKSIKGNRITLSADGTTMTFDKTNAEVDGDSPLLTGSDVEAEYADVDGDVKPAATLTLLMDIEQQASIENRDPQIYGTVSSYDINDFTIIDDSGAERTFDNQMSRTVSFGELKSGDPVIISYAGQLLDTDDEDGEDSFSQPIAIKIVAADAVDSEDAKANYITGVVDSIDADMGLMTLINDITSFEVTASSDLLKDFTEEEKVKVYYEGALSGISVDATNIEAAED